MPSPVPTGFQSKSTPNLPTLRTLQHPTSSPESLSLDHDQASPLSSTVPSEAESTSDDDDDEDEQSNGHLSSLPPQAFYHQHSRSHTYLGPSAFAPPFYNRPPTPLPPSPSLTSLLRPTFSAHTSRPGTPDPSSDEAASHTNAGTGTATPAHYRLPRATPKIPTYEYYGFTLYLSSSLAFMVYILWAYLPSPFLHSLGITYYPNRWWALAVPAWSVMFVLWIYVALAGYNTGHLTLPLDSIACLVDEAANVAVVDRHGNLLRSERASWDVAQQGSKNPPPSPRTSLPSSRRSGVVRAAGQQTPKPRSRQASPARLEEGLDWKTLWNEGTDAVMDIPIGGVCEILYATP